MAMNHYALRSCIDACNACAVECEYCATECLKEDDLKMLSRCIALTRECALVCTTTARLMSLSGEHARILCGVCADMCNACADECELMSEMDHCMRCAIECRRCVHECTHMLEEQYA